MIDIQNLTEEQRHLILAGALATATHGLQGLTPLKAVTKICACLDMPKDSLDGYPEEFLVLLAYLKVGDVSKSKAAAKLAVKTTESRAANLKRAKEKLESLTPEVRDAVVAGAACFDAIGIAMHKSVDDRTSSLIGSALCEVLNTSLPDSEVPSPLHRVLVDTVLDFLVTTGVLTPKTKDPWDTVREGLTAARSMTDDLKAGLKALLEGTPANEEFEEEETPKPTNRNDLN